MADRWQDIVLLVAGVATLLVSLGVIYRYVIRPTILLTKGKGPVWDWLREQLAAKNGEGPLREQVGRIESRQELGYQLFSHIVREVDELAQRVDVNTNQLAILRAQMTEVQKTTTDTATAIDQVHETVDQVHESVTTANTGEVPVVPPVAP